MSALLPKHNTQSIGLIGHTIINYPTPELSRAAVAVMVEAGVDLIELQIPFSEPVADGPLFMAANHAAITAGVTVTQCFDFMREMTQQYKIPFVFMTYANIIFQKGWEAFVQAAVATGAKGCIVPDLPLENAEELRALCQCYHFSMIQVIPPNVTEIRMRELTAAADGFIYAVARSGVTGAKTALTEQLSAFIQRLQVHTSLPIAVGFGIASADDINFLKPQADYAIVGSQGLRILTEQGLSAYQKFWQELKFAANGGD